MSSSPSSMSDQRLISWVLEARLFLQYLQDIQYSLDRELERIKSGHAMPPWQKPLW